MLAAAMAVRLGLPSFIDLLLRLWCKNDYNNLLYTMQVLSGLPSVYCSMVKNICTRAGEKVGLIENVAGVEPEVVVPDGTHQMIRS
jgi:hypothetical protein